MIVKPSKFKIILFKKLSSHELENQVLQRDHQGSPLEDRLILFRRLMTAA